MFCPLLKKYLSLHLLGCSICESIPNIPWVSEAGVEQDDAVVDIFFELVVRHPSLFVHADRTWPAPLLLAAESTSCVQNVGQKLVPDLLPLLGRRTCRKLKVQWQALAGSVAPKYPRAGK